GEPVALGVGANPDRAAEDGEVLAAHEHVAPVDLARSAHVAIGRDPRFAAHQEAELDEASRVAKAENPLARVEPPRRTLARNPIRSTHRARGGTSPLELVEDRLPSADCALAAGAHSFSTHVAALRGCSLSSFGSTPGSRSGSVSDVGRKIL